MSMQFYYGSGSPFSWCVWLVLEHKQIPYEFNLRSLQNGELKTPEYLALNPHGKVPTIVDNDFSVWEAAVIIEYLEECYPENPIFPSDLLEKTTVRRLAAESTIYLYPALRKLMMCTLFNDEPEKVEDALEGLKPELAYFENALQEQNEYFVGKISAIDFVIYPVLALVKRIGQLKPDTRAEKLIGPKLQAFMNRIETLDYFDETIPPHWKE